MERNGSRIILTDQETAASGVGPEIVIADADTDAQKVLRRAERMQSESHDLMSAPATASQGRQLYTNAQKLGAIARELQRYSTEYYEGSPVDQLVLHFPENTEVDRR